MQKHHYIATDSIQVPKIEAIGFSDDTNITHFGPSVRNQYIIHYVLSGTGYFNGNKVSGGEGFLITPGLHEEYYADKDNPWSFIWIISEDDSMQYYFDRHNANTQTGIFNLYNSYKLLPIVEQLKGVIDEPCSSTQLSELFLRMYHSCTAKETNNYSSITKAYFDFSVNYIKLNLHTPLSVAELCQKLGITQPYLYRIFMQQAGCSPKQYIMQRKLEQAKKLLEQTVYSISQIGNTIGFENVLEFSKFFSKHTCLSPTAYRKKHINSN